jgi:mannose-1-phosphate guanylyltransferase
MNGRLNANSHERWAIILAGGDGSRLMPLCHRIAGCSVPKQFCRIFGRTTLLEQTHRRVSLLVPPTRILTVVNRAHELLYSPLLKGILADNLVVQPQNRGTAAAILYALRRLSELNPCASVAVFPSDHFVHNDDVFMAHVDLAFHSVSERPGLILLLGMTPDRAESAYGWIEPDEPIGLGGEVARVRRFWEKPRPQVALQLWEHGCLWNTFVMIGKLTTFITLTIKALPELASAFSRPFGPPDAPEHKEELKRLYACLPDSNFSEEVLARNPKRLGVLRVAGVYWNDLGEPQRVFETLARTKARPAWLKRKVSLFNRKGHRVVRRATAPDTAHDDRRL